MTATLRHISSSVNAARVATQTIRASLPFRIPWKKNGFQGIRLEVDRADTKGWVFLAVDTKPDYADTEDHPATATIWKYRAFYLKDDQKVGQCSAVVEVRVGG